MFALSVVGLVVWAGARASARFGLSCHELRVDVEEGVATSPWGSFKQWQVRDLQEREAET